MNLKTKNVWPRAALLMAVALVVLLLIVSSQPPQRSSVSGIESPGFPRALSLRAFKISGPALTGQTWEYYPSVSKELEVFLRPEFSAPFSRDLGLYDFRHRLDFKAP